MAFVKNNYIFARYIIGIEDFMKRFFSIIGINILIMIVLSIVMIFLLDSWLDSYTHHDESIIVPDVKGVADEEAMAILEEQALVPMVIDSLFADAAPGSVLEQLPEAGLPVKKGRIVYLTINAKSVRMILMPEVADFSSRQAKSILREAGFIVENVKLESSMYDDLALGVLINNQPAVVGHKYPYRSRVTLLVGSSEIEEEITPGDGESENAFFE